MTVTRLLRASFRRRTGDTLFLTAALAANVVVLVTFLSAGLAPGSSSLARHVLVRILFLACAGVTTVFSFAFTWLATRSYIDRRKDELASWLLLGMRPRTAGLLCWGEAALASLGAFAGGTLAALVLNRLFALVLGLLLAGEAPEVPVSAPVLGWAGAVVLLQLGLVGLRVRTAVRRTSLRTLFQARRSPEAPPRGSRVRTWAGAGCLVLAWGGALVPSPGLAVLLILPILALAVAGTFLTFEGALPRAAAGLRNRFGLASPGWLVALAQTSFRLGRNARSMALLGVLVATAATACGTLLVMASSLPLQLDRIAPNSLEVAAGDQETADRVGRALGRVLEEAGLRAREVRVRVLSAEVPGAGAVSLVPYSDWQAARQAAGRPAPALEPGAALVLSRMGPADGYPDPVVVGTAAGKLAFRPVRIEEGTAVALAHAPSPLALPDAGWEALAGTGARPAWVLAWTLEAGAEVPLEALRRAAAPAEVLVRAEAEASYRQEIGALVFIGAFLALAFLAAAIAVLAFQLLEGARDDRARHRYLDAVGMAPRDRDRAVDRQVALTFALPLGFGSLHSVFALALLPTVSQFPVPPGTWAVLGTALAAFSAAAALVARRAKALVRTAPDRPSPW